MKHYYCFLLFVLLFLFCFNGFGQRISNKDRARAAVHQINIIEPSDRGKCTAEAVGSHTIIIASHCLGLTPDEVLFEIDKDKKMAVPDVILSDGNDHSLIVLKSLDVIGSWKEFDTWIDFKITTPIEGERVYMYGTSQLLYEANLAYREGYFSGWGIFEKDKYRAGGFAMVFVLPVLPGDSGSLVFNKNGEVVAEVSQRLGDSITGAFPFLFTPKQLAAIR